MTPRQRFFSETWGGSDGNGSGNGFGGTKIFDVKNFGSTRRRVFFRIGAGTEIDDRAVFTRTGPGTVCSADAVASRHNRETMVALLKNDSSP